MYTTLPWAGFNAHFKKAFMTQNAAEFCNIWFTTLAFKKKSQYFGRQSTKITENSDLSINPRLLEFTPHRSGLFRQGLEQKRILHPGALTLGANPTILEFTATTPALSYIGSSVFQLNNFFFKTLGARLPVAL
jgi:hypothetical protein